MASLRDRFAYVPGQAKDRFVRNGIVVLAVFAAVVYFIYSGGRIPFVPKSGYTVTADFATSANVSPGKTPVRVAGVNVGEVESLERLPGGRGVRVKMRITDKGVKLKSDASAHIYWRTLLGFAFYVQLDQGVAQSELGDQEIPMSRTTTQQELDQVLSAFTPPTRKGVQTLFREFDKGFNSKSQSGRTLDALGPAMRQVGPGLEGLRGVNHGDLTQTVRGASNLMGVLARNEVQLGQLIANGDQTLAVTAAKRAAIGSMLDNGPSTLDQTRATMIRLRSTLDRLDPIADALRPGARQLTPTSRALRPALDQLNPTLDDARPTLTSLRPALIRLRSASRAGVPFMRNLAPALTRAHDTILPGLQVKGETGRKAYEVIGPTIAGVADTSGLFDANGYVQRFQAANGGANSLGFLPCSADVLGGTGLKCADVQKVIGSFLGGPTSGVTVPDGAGVRSSSGSVESGETNSTPVSPDTAKRVSSYIEGVL